MKTYVKASSKYENTAVVQHSPKLGAYVDFIQNGKVIDKMTLWAFEPDEYESFDEYLDGVLDEVALELEEYNRDVKQTVSHW